MKIFIIFLIACSVQASLPQGTYYQRFNKMITKGVSLKKALRTHISQHRTFSYKTARKYLFGQIHLTQDAQGNYGLMDVYCENNYGKSHGVGPMKIPRSNYVNCEHTWPQSRFNKNESKSKQKNDMHHLYPVDSRANSSRGNITFAEVNGRDVHERCAASQRGRDINSSRTSFEPPLNHRGNVARALFYFSVRYNMSIADHEEVHLRKWHLDDPVDDFERSRNEQIYLLQGNRNPFIDAPDLTEEIENF